MNGKLIFQEEGKGNFSRGGEMVLQEVKKNDPSIGAEYTSSIGEEYMHLFKRTEYVPSIGKEHIPLQEEEKYVTLQ